MTSTSCSSAFAISGSTGPPASTKNAGATGARGDQVGVRQPVGVHRALDDHARDATLAAAMELIHTCYRIGEIDRSVAFYEALGFEERRRMPIREEAINVFMGLPGDGDRLELTYNHGVDSYELGTGLQPHRGHGRPTSTTRSPSSTGRASSRRSRRTACARAAPGSASCATRTATASSSSSGARTLRSRRTLLDASSLDGHPGRAAPLERRARTGDGPRAGEMRASSGRRSART